MKQYIVTEKQLRKLKELTESDFYWGEEGRELRYLVEDIESAELTFAPAIEKLAWELSLVVHRELTADKESKDVEFLRVLHRNTYYQRIYAITTFLPSLCGKNWAAVWDNALSAEQEEPGAAYDVFMKALEDKE